jgi:hypothetical protein
MEISIARKPVINIWGCVTVKWTWLFLLNKILKRKTEARVTQAKTMVFRTKFQ